MLSFGVVLRWLEALEISSEIQGLSVSTMIM